MARGSLPRPLTPVLPAPAGRSTIGGIALTPGEVAADGLRWVANQAIPADGGLAWLRPNWPERVPADDLYEGTAGVLLGLAEARLTGITEFDDVAQAAAGRLQRVITRVVEAGGPPAEYSELEREHWAPLYLGLAGQATALRLWATVSGDGEAAQTAQAGIELLAEVAPKQRLSTCYEVIHGEAGILLALVALGGSAARPAIEAIADRLVAATAWQGDEPDWYKSDSYKFLMPNFSHGAAGIGFSLARACRLAVRASGLPARLHPGFWDNLGQCCGTAGVGERVLDWYRETGDPGWLDWADTLAADLIARRITDETGTRWSNTEHTADPPELPPQVGWMHGAAGIAGFLFRLARTHADGCQAARLAWPDAMSSVTQAG